MTNNLKCKNGFNFGQKIWLKIKNLVESLSQKIRKSIFLTSGHYRVQKFTGIQNRVCGKKYFIKVIFELSTLYRFSTVNNVATLSKIVFVGLAGPRSRHVKHSDNVGHVIMFCG